MWSMQTTATKAESRVEKGRSQCGGANERQVVLPPASILEGFPQLANV